MTQVGDMEYHCNNCGSHSILLTQTGFSWGLFFVGLLIGSFILAPILFFVIGPFAMFVPLVTGFLWGKTTSNKVKYRCLSCGNSGLM